MFCHCMCFHSFITPSMSPLRSNSQITGWYDRNRGRQNFCWYSRPSIISRISIAPAIFPLCVVNTFKRRGSKRRGVAA